MISMPASLVGPDCFSFGKKKGLAQFTVSTCCNMLNTLTSPATCVLIILCSLWPIVLYRLPYFRSISISDYLILEETSISNQYWLLQKSYKMVQINWSIYKQNLLYADVVTSKSTNTYYHKIPQWSAVPDCQSDNQYNSSGQVDRFLSLLVQ